MRYIQLKYFILLVTCLSISQVVSASSGKHDQFSVVAFGDMPYFLPGDYAKFEHLLQFINTKDQTFNVFVGDIKSSKTTCSDDVYTKVYDYLNLCQKPLIYTPGDNEWTDCAKPKEKRDPDERLAYLRSLFYKDSKSLGKERMELVSQSSYKGYETYVENKRWSVKNVTFATVHLVGSDNNLIANDPKSNKEYYGRCAADSFWLHETFAQAIKANSPGIMIFCHADMFTADKGLTGFNMILKELRALTKAYGKPVWLVNGDSHRYVVDKPFFNDKVNESTLLNFTRAQVFGEYDVEAVTITVDPNTPEVFSIRELLVPGNH